MSQSSDADRRGERGAMPRGRKLRPGRRRAVWLLIAAFAAGGCPRPADEEVSFEEIETVEVGEGLDAHLSTEYDEQARPLGGESLGGVLPGSFPDDLPLPEPSSLTDFGPAPGGEYVELFSPRSPAELRGRWERALERAGWSRLAPGRYSKTGREVRIAIADTRPGTTIRIEY